jgi:hypothetical protein
MTALFRLAPFCPVLRVVGKNRYFFPTARSLRAVERAFFCA